MFRYILLFLFFLTGPSYALNPELEKIVHKIEDRPDYEQAYVIADLDETLIDSTARRFYSYREAALKMGGSSWTNPQKVLALNISDFLNLENHYDVDSLFDAIGLPDSNWRKFLNKTAFDIYLSEKFMDLDQPIPGSIEFVGRLRKAGAIIFYVSSRYEDTQLEATKKSLAMLGLYDAGEDIVILRPRGLSSISFKQNSYQFIKTRAAERGARVHLVMENEPENMNALTENFPEADSIFIEGAFFKYEPLKGSPLKLRDYR